MFKGNKYVLQNLDGLGGADGGAGGSDAGNSTSVADSLSNVKGENTQSTEPSLLSNVQDEQGGGNQSSEGISFPEKYTVKNEDGTVNIDASTRKLLDGYTHLSKKMGETGGVVPDTADGYKIDFNPADLGLPESLTPELVKKDPDFKQFTEVAHKAGFTNEQINLVAGQYLNIVQSLLDRRDENDEAAGREALMETWKTQAEFDTGIQNAKRAFNHFASDQDKALIDTIGNNPLVIRVLANIGATMREDSPARNAQPMESRETISALMKSEAYTDTNHPDHERVYNQVSEYYRKAYGDEVMA